MEANKTATENAQTENATVTVESITVQKTTAQDRLKTLTESLKKATALMDKNSPAIKWAADFGVQNVASSIGKPGQEAGTEVLVESLIAMMEKRQKDNRAANKLLAEGIEQLTQIKMELPTIVNTP
jgi:hypothetical protein